MDRGAAGKIALRRGHDALRELCGTVHRRSGTVQDSEMDFVEVRDLLPGEGSGRGRILAAGAHPGPELLLAFLARDRAAPNDFRE
jgi:hypothetical protein